MTAAVLLYAFIGTPKLCGGMANQTVLRVGSSHNTCCQNCDTVHPKLTSLNLWGLPVQEAELVHLNHGRNYHDGSFS